MTEIVVVDDLRVFTNKALSTMIEDADGITSIRYFRSEGEALVGVMNIHMNDERIDQLWLDHDLGMNPSGEPGTTISLVQILCEGAMDLGLPLLVGEILVHTSNPAVKDRMVDDLRRAGYNVRSVNANDYFERWVE